MGRMPAGGLPPAGAQAAGDAGKSGGVTRRGTRASRAVLRRSDPTRGCGLARPRRLAEECPVLVGWLACSVAPSAGAVTVRRPLTGDLNRKRVVLAVTGAGGWRGCACRCGSPVATRRGAAAHGTVCARCGRPRHAGAKEKEKEKEVDLGGSSTGFGWSLALTGTAAGPPPGIRAPATSLATHLRQPPASTVLPGFPPSQREPDGGLRPSGRYGTGRPADQDGALLR
jgi:hypothetical protein